MLYGMNNFGSDLGARLEIFVSFYWHQVIWKAAHSTETATERKEGRKDRNRRGDWIGVASLVLSHIL